MRVCLKDQDTSAKFMCVFLKNLGATSGLHHFGNIQSLHLVTGAGLKKVLETDPRTQKIKETVNLAGAMKETKRNTI